MYRKKNIKECNKNVFEYYIFYVTESNIGTFFKDIKIDSTLRVSDIKKSKPSILLNFSFVIIVNYAKCIKTIQ